MKHLLVTLQVARVQLVCAPVWVCLHVGTEAGWFGVPSGGVWCAPERRGTTDPAVYYHPAPATSPVATGTP